MSFRHSPSLGLRGTVLADVLQMSASVQVPPNSSLSAKPRCRASLLHRRPPAPRTPSSASARPAPAPSARCASAGRCIPASPHARPSSLRSLFGPCYAPDSPSPRQPPETARHPDPVQRSRRSVPSFVLNADWARRTVTICGDDQCCGQSQYKCVSAGNDDRASYRAQSSVRRIAAPAIIGQRGASPFIDNVSGLSHSKRSSTKGAMRNSLVQEWTTRQSALTDSASRAARPGSQIVASGS
jgi:hypothetical protein